MRAVVGHAQSKALLARAVAGGQVSHAYLFAGPRGIGKTTLAIELARLLQCERPNLAASEPCGECRSCHTITHGNHPDVTLVEVEEGKRQLGIEAVRESVIHLANLAPSVGRWRVFVIPMVERMTANTTNALLKTLEEPPERVVLLLTSCEPESLLPTLLSRCQLVPMQPLRSDEVAGELMERWNLPEGEAHELAGLANGQLGWALRAHEHPELRMERAEQLARLAKLVFATRHERLAAAGKLATDAEAARESVDLWLLWWRDVVLAAYGSTHLASAGRARDEAVRVGQTLDGPRAEAFLRALIAARSALDANANPRLTLDVLMLDLPSLSDLPVVSGSQR